MGKDFDYASEDGMLFSEVATPEPEICLGKTFNSAEERREYYRNELRKYLKDPDFRAIDGFPIGEDEDIIALSDPPYYCACPNPWIPDFIKEWESQKIPTNIPYKREPFAVDVKQDKGDPMYNVHAYYTKVPPRAIMQYLLHYTEPGDIVLDGFCGSGMTGVAALMCNDEEEIKGLGYTIDSKGAIYDGDKYITDIGSRWPIIGDLSPLATFISANHASEVNINEFNKKALSILKKAKQKYSWLYETTDESGNTAIVNYIVWSDVVVCPECGHEMVVYNECLDGSGKIKGNFECPSCHHVDKKNMFNRCYVTEYDEVLNKTIEVVKQVPVLINYTSHNGKRLEKQPDKNDWNLIRTINDLKITDWIPSNGIPVGFNTEQPRKSHNITNVHQFYTKRNRILLSYLYSLCKDNNTTLFWFTSIYSRTHRLNRYMPNHHRHVGPMAGTLYIPFFQTEINLFILLEEKMKSIQFLTKINGHAVVTTNSCSNLIIPDNSVDYIFLDPPFGANINYSELSFILESWLKVKTENKEEAIENAYQNKGIFEYRKLMTECFAEMYRVLKPGHWMTVEFSNTDSSVWNSIQTALAEVGFIIASVNSLNKGRGGMQSIIGPVAVKQDLILTLYKPDESFKKQITTSVGTEAVWNFVRKHLEYLPLVKKQGESTMTVPERDPRIIYDRMISYFVGNNMLIPISSPDFLAQMPTRFAERNGLYYLPDQVQEYDKMVFKQQIKESSDDNALFVCDERSSIAWIRAQLKEKPMTLGELTPLFMKEISSSWTKGERKPELRELLEQNFLCYEGKDDVPSFIHGWLSTMYKNLRNKTKDDPELREKAKGRWYIPDPNKASDLEKIREKSLLKEFSTYETSKGKINEFRIEAVHAGFKKAWQDKNYALIKSICERMPSSVVEEDEKLLMWYSGALTRLGE